MLARIAFALMILCLPCAAHSQGRSWDANQANLRPGETTYSKKARIPSPRPIVTPGPEVPESIRGLSGRWIGWGGVGRTISVAVDVERLTATGGTVAFFMASDWLTNEYEQRFAVSLVDGRELEGGMGGWTYLKLRLRPDGHADYMVHWSQRAFWGVLTRQPPVGNAQQSAPASVAPAGSATAGPFDGTWRVTQECPASGSAQGYSVRFVIEVRNGVVSGQRGISGSPDSMSYSGRVGVDGRAVIRADGLTGPPASSLGGVAAGTPYGFSIAATFAGTSGTGTRSETRPCSFAFVKAGS